MRVPCARTTPGLARWPRTHMVNLLAGLNPNTASIPLHVWPRCTAANALPGRVRALLVALGALSASHATTDTLPKGAGALNASNVTTDSLPNACLPGPPAAPRLHAMTHLLQRHLFLCVNVQGAWHVARCTLHTARMIVTTARGWVGGVGAWWLARVSGDVGRRRLAAYASQAQVAAQLRVPQAVKRADEWRQWGSVGDPVLHMELRRWADTLVVAPLSANTLAKAAGGLCDNLLTCVVRAWDWQRPLLVIGVATLLGPSALARAPV